MKTLVLVFVLCAFVESLDVKTLLEKGERLYIRSYIELPEPDTFITLDLSNLRPCKFVNYTDYLGSLFNDWDLDQVAKNLETSLVYGSLWQKIKESKVDSGANLRSFLVQANEYVHETYAQFKMPQFVREALNMPSVLDCNYMYNRFNDVTFEFNLNKEEFDQLKSSNFDQLICLLKGDISFLLIDEEYFKKLSNENLAEAQIKDIKYVMPDLKKGECIYIPKGWNYAVKSEFSWTYSISWNHFNASILQTDCENKDESKIVTKISKHIPAKNTNKLAFLKFFVAYLDSDPNTGLDKEKFLSKIQNDQTITKTISKCENDCVKIMQNIFTELDNDKDERFTINDIQNLDHQSALKTNLNLERLIQELGKISMNIMENLKKAFDQLKNLGAQYDMTDKITGMLKEKLNDWVKNLSDKEKEKFEGLQIDNIVDILMKGADNKAHENDKNRRAKIKKEHKQENKQETKPKDSIYQDDRPEQNNPLKDEVFINIDNNEESEIFAENEEL